MGRRTFVKTLVLLSALAMAAAACGGGGTGGTTGGGGGATKGGSLTVGAEQWTDCMNPINNCASAFWQSLMIWEVLPRAMQWDLQGIAQASPLLTEAPTLANGGLKNNPFTITYHLNPKAVWDDGTAITSKDFDFTWKAIMNSKPSYTQTGYDQITSIDTSVPATVTIHFKAVFIDWQDLFGGNHFGLIEAAKFPTFVGQAKPDLGKVLSTGPLTFSGGPWKQTAFTQTSSTFVRNDKYWGNKTNLNQMIWKPEKDQNTEIQDLLSGTIQAAFPQPSNVSILQALKPNANAKAIAGAGNFYEAIWMNNQDKGGVLTDKKVREALMYSVPRQDIIDGLIKLNQSDAKVNNCGYISLPGKTSCAKTFFDQFTYDPTKAKSILTSDGWNCSKTPCTKGSKTLELTYRFCNGNKRRGTTFDLLKEKVKASGFVFKQVTQGSDCTSPLFTQTLPNGDYQVADYAQGPLTDPSVTSNAACEAIPTKANGLSGGNYERWCSTHATDLMHQSDKELDPAKRQALLDQVYQLEVDDRVLLPLYNLPNITMFRSDKVAGPVGDVNSSVYGGLFNIDQWYCKTARTGTAAC